MYFQTNRILVIVGSAEEMQCNRCYMFINISLSSPFFILYLPQILVLLQCIFKYSAVECFLLVV